MFNADEEDKAFDKRKEGYLASCYCGYECKNCGRWRVMQCENGKEICEKCSWDQNAGCYDMFFWEI